MNSESEKYQDLAQHTVGEGSHTYREKIESGFFEKYLGGEKVLDIGYKGYSDNSVPILKNAIGIDNGYPGYDGRTLPFSDGSVDAVWVSHTLEHIADYCGTIREWHRVLKVKGYLVCIVPHMYLYEGKTHPPSRWNADHKRFYTASRLLREFEESLPQRCYRVRHLCENENKNHDYEVCDKHPPGPYEIECVVQKTSEL